MITFYTGAIEARNVEHSNYKFSLDKTLSILFKSAEVSLLGSPLLIGFGLGLLGGGGPMFKLEESLRNCELRGQARKQLFAEAFVGPWSNMDACGIEGIFPS